MASFSLEIQLAIFSSSRESVKMMPMMAQKFWYVMAKSRSHVIKFLFIDPQLQVITGNIDHILQWSVAVLFWGKMFDMTCTSKRPMHDNSHVMEIRYVIVCSGNHKQNARWIFNEILSSVIDPPLLDLSDH